MASRIVKSIFWLATFSGLGFGLLAFTTAYQKSNQPDYPGVEKVPFEKLKQKSQFVNIIQAAAESDEPLYRAKKEDLEKIVRK